MGTYKTSGSGDENSVQFDILKYILTRK